MMNLTQAVFSVALTSLVMGTADWVLLGAAVIAISKIASTQFSIDDPPPTLPAG